MRRDRALCDLKNVRADIRMELKMLLGEVLPLCSAGSSEFNARAIAWIEKNGARFRKKWERFHNGKKESIEGN
jgi:hypothetical protein